MTKVYGLLDEDEKWLSFSSTEYPEGGSVEVSEEEQQITLRALETTRDRAQYLIEKLEKARGDAATEGRDCEIKRIIKGRTQ